MRNLNLDEISKKISEYSSDIIYSDKEHLEVKITQFFNFLNEQPISKRTLERISEDFNELKKNLNKKNNSTNWKNTQNEIMKSLVNREKQGAFAFFEINQKFNIEKKYSNHYIELSKEWYRVGGNFDNYQEYFNTYFFEPFIDIIKWYLSESKIKNEYDYFSREEITQFNNNFEKLKVQINELSFGQELIFNETDELKKLISGLNKKNWTELIKGKFNDMILSELISVEIAKKLFKTITGEVINFIN